MTSLSAEDCQDECISHALNVRSAWALSNFHKLFKLYRASPRMSSYLMEWFLPRERKLALKTVIKAYVSYFVPPWSNYFFHLVTRWLKQFFNQSVVSNDSLQAFPAQCDDKVFCSINSIQLGTFAPQRLIKKSIEML